jgi:glycosyltransferase involved in cell wall biosynthesis
MGPLVSIIIPVYNAASTVGEAIDSALGQTYENTEVIVVNDGSTDNSLSICQSFGTRVNLISSRNFGGAAARNTGLRIARGEFIQFLDSDDILYSHKIERLLPHAVLSQDSSIIASSWDLQEEREENFSVHNLNFAAQDPFEWCLTNHLQTAAPLHATKSLLEIGGFDETLNCCQEFDLHLRLFAAGRSFKPVDEPMYRFRRQPGSVSSNFAKILQVRQTVFQKLWSNPYHPLSFPNRAKAVAAQLAWDARQLARMGHRKQAREGFRFSEMLDKNAPIKVFRGYTQQLLAKSITPVWTETILCQLRSLQKQIRYKNGKRNKT